MIAGSDAKIISRLHALTFLITRSRRTATLDSRRAILDDGDPVTSDPPLPSTLHFSYVTAIGSSGDYECTIGERNKGSRFICRERQSALSRSLA